ncbi:MAG: hypothetical protein A2W22_03530 [Candidatus Levybacteria bacterium RBG_16_35_11]|nr:MAG: hypothetical protein A2W22_03530 [Candidatus Levybacteria bacterium RBG_16_35_11]
MKKKPNLKKIKTKSKNYQIDQSGKIEQTSINTIIALSNNIRYAVLLPKKTKRALQEIFRNEGRPRMFIYDTFCALITIVLINTKPNKKVVIDREYKNEDLIKARILEFIKVFNMKPVLNFSLVGKSSRAHLLAAKVANKKVKPNVVVKLEDISSILWPAKKTGYSGINRTEGNLTQDWLPGGRKPSRSFNKHILSRKNKKVKKNKNGRRR